MIQSMQASHQIRLTWKERLARILPFGIGHQKPKHFRDMFGILWRNRDNLPYAWKVITQGVCDGCALGVAGLFDWTIKGPHLCMTRLNLLRLNTVGTIEDSHFTDIARLEKMDNRELRELGRLPYPMIREKKENQFRRISWEEAYSRIAQKIRSTTPDRTAWFVTSRGVTNEIYYMAQKVARFLGTNNVDNAARICHSPSTAAMKAAVGVSATTCSYKDWYGTDLIVFFGSNPANDQPVSTKYLHEAKALGTKVAMVNPYLEPGMKQYWVPSTAASALFGTSIADYWFPVTQGGDIAFLYGVIKILLENNWYNTAFAETRVNDLDQLKQAAASLSFEELEKSSGLSHASMLEFAILIREAKNAVLVWSMGITQHTYGADAVQMILNLGLLQGYVGKDLNGLMPIRGHSSVQGGAEMGAYATAFPGGKPINSENAKALEALYHFPIPDRPGLPATEMVEACADGRLDLFYNVGGNMLRNLPEPDHVRSLLAQVPMRVHQDIILNDQMLIPAQETVLLLPAKTRYEQDDGGTETSTERRVMFSPEIPRQVGEAKAEWKILREIAAATYPERAPLLGCETGQAMREEIARVVPFYEGVQHLHKTGDAFQYGGKHLCAEGQFPTPDGKARFIAVPIPISTMKKEEFMVSTRRGKQFNSLIYAEIDPLNGSPRDAVLMSAEDAEKLNLKHGERIALKNDLADYPGTVFIAPIAPGNLQIHWPEGNVIIPRGLVDKGGGVPDYNAYVRVEKN